MKANKETLNLIKSFEGLRLKPYLCSAKVPTIGYGSTYYENGTKVSLQDPEITEEKAVQLLAFHLRDLEAIVSRLVKVPINENQFGALLSFSYNVGAGALGKSTLMKLLNAGDYKGAGDQLLVWNKAGGAVMPGLTKRREAERALFNTVAAQPTNSLPNGPSDDEIRVKLEEIEKEIVK